MRMKRLYGVGLLALRREVGSRVTVDCQRLKLARINAIGRRKYLDIGTIVEAVDLSKTEESRTQLAKMTWLKGEFGFLPSGILTDLTSIVGLMFPKIQQYQSRFSLLVEQQNML